MDNNIERTEQKREEEDRKRIYSIPISRNRKLKREIKRPEIIRPLFSSR